jgi:hypothetical protein
MQQSEQLNELAKAFSAAQGRIRNPKKNIDSEEGYKTAPLSKFYDAVKRPFKDNGLSFVQDLSSKDLEISVSTRIMHSSGQWLESNVVNVTAKDNSPEERGLATYNAKKNSFCAMIGITGENEVEEKLTTSGATSHKGGLFESAADRKEAKQAMLDDLKMVSSQADLDEFTAIHQENMDKMIAEDQTYVSDVLREMKVLKQGFDKEKDNLKGKI